MEPKFPQATPPPQEKPVPNEQSIAIDEISAMLEITEETVFKRKHTISNVEVAELLKSLDEAKAAGNDLSSIKNINERIAKLKQEAGKIAVRSCLEKAQLAAKAKDADPLMAMQWYFATLKKLEECKASIPEEELEQIQREIKTLEADLGKTRDDNDYETVQKKELEILQQKWIQLYDSSLLTCENHIKSGNLNLARDMFDRINKKWYSERIANNPFLSSELQNRIAALHEKLKI